MSFQGKKNIYTCPKGHQTVTVDVDDGTTPFMLRCRQRDDDGKHNCTEFSQSSGYNLTPDQQLFEPEYEWFKPTSLKGYSADMKEHLLKGGLELRKIKRIESKQ